MSNIFDKIICAVKGTLTEEEIKVRAEMCNRAINSGVCCGDCRKCPYNHPYQPKDI